MKKYIFIFFIFSSFFNFCLSANELNHEIEEKIFYEKAIVLDLKEVEVEDDCKDFIKKRFIVKLLITSGKFKNKKIEIEHNIGVEQYHTIEVQKNNKVEVSIKNLSENLEINILGFEKTSKIYFILMIVILFILIFAGYKGFKSIITLLITFLLIFYIMIPMLLKGYSPILITIFVSIIATIITLTTVAGFTKKSFAAISGSAIGFILTGFFSITFTKILKLSGIVGIESTYLQMIIKKINMQEVLIAGIMLGALGAVMDVSISIASAIEEIHLASNKYKFKDLLKAGNNIGKDMLGTMINTLILAYTGSSFTIAILFVHQKTEYPLFHVLNLEFIAIEILRSLAGTFGMLLTIPVTAFIAAYIYSLPKTKNIKK